MNVPIFKTIKYLVLSAFIFSSTNAAVAEEIRIVAGSQGNANIVMPTTGQTKNAVTVNFGQPQEASGTVGEPAISRWEYNQFYVYFEHEHVIHSVLKK